MYSDRGHCQLSLAGNSEFPGGTTYRSTVLSSHSALVAPGGHGSRVRVQFGTRDKSRESRPRRTVQRRRRRSSSSE
eukprot:454972-Hanusia_phi.AAC.2